MSTFLFLTTSHVSHAIFYIFILFLLSTLNLDLVYWSVSPFAHTALRLAKLSRSGTASKPLFCLAHDPRHRRSQTPFSGFLLLPGSYSGNSSLFWLSLRFTKSISELCSAFCFQKEAWSWVSDPSILEVEARVSRSLFWFYLFFRVSRACTFNTFKTLHWGNGHPPIVEHSCF